MGHHSGKAQQGLALVGHINRAINLAITPVAPSPWLSAVEAINADGDCKAYATAKFFALMEAGVALDRVRLVVVHQRGHIEDHIVVAVWLNRWLILDNATLIMMPDEQSRARRSEC
jgi:predicted transglutaminase-like cysteine proteinase